MGTGGIEVSPLGPDHYYSINSSCLYPLFKKKHNRSHPCIKLSISAKISLEPYSCSIPMHLNKLCNKDRACWVHYVLTPSSLWFFSRRCGRRLRRRRGRIDRVSPTPKPLSVDLGDHVSNPLCNKLMAYEPLCKDSMYLCVRLCLTYGMRCMVSVPFLFSVHISYWSRDWYHKHSGSRKRVHW